MRRCNDEVRALQSLNHINIIGYMESGFWRFRDKDRYFIVMEKADSSLEDCYRGLPLEKKVDIFRQIIEGIKASHIHNPKIIHRDLKPANILIKDNVVKITDFGISYFGEEQERKTSTSEIVGSRNWRSPQTELGRQDEPSFKEDLYSIGKILYCLLSEKKFLYREYFNSTEYFLPYIHKDPKYLVFEDFFIHTIAENHRDIYDKLEDLIEEFENAWERFKMFPKDREIEELIRLAHICHMKRRYEEYKEILIKAYNLDRDNPYGQYYYGKLLYRENRQESLKCFYEVANNDSFNDYFILADIGLLLFHNDDKLMCEILVQRSSLLKESGVPPKNLGGLSEESKRYLKYSALGKR